MSAKNLQIVSISFFLIAEYLWKGSDLLSSIAERTWLTLLSPHPFLPLKDTTGTEEVEEEVEVEGEGEGEGEKEVEKDEEEVKEEGRIFEVSSANVSSAARWRR